MSRAGLQETLQVTLQVVRFVVDPVTGVGADVDVCVVAECDAGDVGSVVAVVGGTLFPSQALGTTCPPAL